MHQSRRDFLIRSAVVGGGLAVGITWMDAAGADEAVAAAPWDQPLPAGATEYSPWLSVGRNGIVTVRVGTPDLGNGVVTQNLMTVTEELYCDWGKIRAEYASVNRNYVQGQIYSKQIGPRTFFGRSTGPQLMAILLQVGASARERLKEAAAQAWKVPRSEIVVKDSVLIHAKSGRKLGFGDVAQQAAAIKLDAEPTPKPPEEWWFVGKASPPRVQQPLLVNGSAQFGLDVHPPGMVYAALMQAPVQGGRLKSYDFEKIRRMPGVIGVAVVDPNEPRPRMDPKTLPYGPPEMTAPQSAVAVVPLTTGKRARRWRRCRSSGTMERARSGSRTTRWSRRFAMPSINLARKWK
ncbi:molybdopterin cofactor-binding domain-containing protein [Variovorax saccharolyticus]|uniref:molybdopterin cofactor-binding domain-containing protein n=1 Tax=Variovorax saccharolyticus TaxID=3053516 RepID=UPI002576BBBE|nr:molybdopterin cofactor-binding domain-containing protein [Variovorax sp. J22R187]MDM0021787.1 molybdopterin-dependent oxidoreductase [Variovorax sp. J22R187]